MRVSISALGTCAALAALLLCSPLLAAPPEQSKPDEQADAPPIQVPRTGSEHRATAINDAWDVLGTGVADPKTDLRISAIVALGSLTDSKRAVNDVEKALTDPDRDVRLAAVTAAGNMKSTLLLPALRQTLDDPAPDVSFAASQILWQMGDHSGQEILLEVISGQRKSAPGVFRSGLHTANKDLHSPAALAAIGAQQGAYALVGPFGIGLDAARLLMKNSNSANSARVAAVTLLASDKSPVVNQELISALRDRDYFVRAAAARGLGEFHTDSTLDALLDAFADPKPLVRYMAAAAYIRAASEPAKKEKKEKRSRRKTPSLTVAKPAAASQFAPSPNPLP